MQSDPTWRRCPVPNAVEPLLDVRKHETFLADQAAVEAAYAQALRFSTERPIQTREEAGEVADAITALKNARVDLEKHKLEITEEWRASTDHVNGHYKELKAKVEGSERALKDQALVFKRAEDAKVLEEKRQREAEEAEKHRKAEAAAQEAQEAAELAREDSSPEIQQLADETHRDAAAAAMATATPAPAIHDAPKGLRGSHGAFTTRTVYKHTISDPGLVPDWAKTIDRAVIKARIDAEAKVAKAAGRDFDLEIPGVRIYPEEIGVSR